MPPIRAITIGRSVTDAAVGEGGYNVLLRPLRRLASDFLLAARHASRHRQPSLPFAPPTLFASPSATPPPPRR
jgi:hypothetical protein